ncbi:hypothetical protein F2Q70_00038532 [Brassica cretica]|uniref:Uncharacterized protein n=1 Tax=Brassica cretica TaxID=69181 RepID=A0A8S9K6T7_BRACR|nr:hypothetical protein F2Q70_00038532 [Brassica cretica]KAF2618737.1 hypothetical protein F2Q68_00039170 [Brassica cretica]
MVINVISGGLEMSGISHTAAKKSSRNAKNGLEDPVSVELPLLRKNGTLSLEPKEILSMRYVQTDEEPVTKFLKAITTLRRSRHTTEKLREEGQAAKGADASMIEPEANLEEEELSDWMQPHGCNSMNGPIDPTLWMEPVDAALWMQNLWIQKSSDYEDNLKHDELNNLVRPPEKLHSTNLISDEPKPSLISSHKLKVSLSIFHQEKTKRAPE